MNLSNSGLSPPFGILYGTSTPNTLSPVTSPLLSATSPRSDCGSTGARIGNLHLIGSSSSNTRTGSQQAPLIMGSSVDSSGFTSCQGTPRLSSHTSFSVVVDASPIVQKVNNHQSGGKLLNNYKFLHVIGTGSVSKVKLCEDVNTGERYAVKIVDKHMLKRVGGYGVSSPPLGSSAGNHSGWGRKRSSSGSSVLLNTPTSDCCSGGTGGGGGPVEDTTAQPNWRFRSSRGSAGGQLGFHANSAGSPVNGEVSGMETTGSGGGGVFPGFGEARAPPPQQQQQPYRYGFTGSAFPTAPEGATSPQRVPTPFTATHVSRPQQQLRSGASSANSFSPSTTSPLPELSLPLPTMPVSGLHGMTVSSSDDSFARVGTNELAPFSNNQGSHICNDVQATSNSSNTFSFTDIRGTVGSDDMLMGGASRTCSAGFLQPHHSSSNPVSGFSSPSCHHSSSRLQRRSSGGGGDNMSGVQRVQREVEILRRLHHPNVVELVDVVEDPGHHKLYVVVELAEFGEVATVNYKTGSVNEDEEGSTTVSEGQLKRIMRGVVDGLVYVHERNIVHLDVKPENVLLTAEGNVKLSDFSCSFITNDEEGQLSAVLTTPLYSPPEILRDRSAGTIATLELTKIDIWGVGMVAFTLARGLLPFPGARGSAALLECLSTLSQGGIRLDQSIIRSDGQTDTTPPNYFSPAFCDFVASCLKLNPYERPTMAQLRQHPWLA